MDSVQKQTILLVKRMSEFAILPSRGSDLAAGYDLSAAYAATVPARGKALCKTDLAIATPLDCYARIAPRSGLAWKKSIDVGAGVVDADYRGNVGVILFNLSDEDFEVQPGDRIAQLILERIHTPQVQEVDELPDTLRGAGGFGSTGVATVGEPDEKRTRLSPSDGGEGEDNIITAVSQSSQLLLPAAELLLFLSEVQANAKSGCLCVSEDSTGGEEVRKRLDVLKRLALGQDDRLVACMQSFRVTHDLADTCGTLELLTNDATQQ
uniref:Deoxyuridine 5'-triphosphate nucleotidohydrolase n=1 Tax=Octactis speculum TaxID=3111310 RepID=A0A7S2CWN6_9STRA|mmetsp:Transcript_40865/g.55652  ORF Transcript_40865/g.55652 Transcript_40865/m.55652 type:complete len:266 (+) Transcript_40865:45-842(+)|eukprot:CAMPEP_0185769534 /NCGR_PEP_ID=MMETSP1174-20130828/54620_1 /TAXON_ID=35687 /ORGANISM="Dictyocha speculum, Strain CCMP1381" /LENGTH=265 /DNA_ID=CAMNT_0028454637 /DNA_START=19 /DNA_END=816 /DNA_ORIENTATION=+